jgi:hypothetical protein
MAEQDAYAAVARMVAFLDWYTGAVIVIIVAIFLVDQWRGK